MSTDAGCESETVTYQRERVYRRQTINEKIEEAIVERCRPGSKAGRRCDHSGRRRPFGPAATRFEPKEAYALRVRRLFFAAKLAQYTTFFRRRGGPQRRAAGSRDSVADAAQRVHGRLVNQNELNLREAGCAPSSSATARADRGTLDLTNYFDRNAAANDETTQFLSDALVNNQMLGSP
jgi:hypothetical protein